MRIERSTRGLLFWTLAAASLLATLPLAAAAEWDGERDVAIIAAFSSIPVFGVLLLLVFIETLGIRFLGARRGWRTSKAAAWTVVAHASGGWLVGAGTSAVGFILMWRFLTVFERRGAVPEALGMAGLALWFAAPLVGLLVFETLVWIGWRALKYANEARAPRVGAGDNAATEGERP